MNARVVISYLLLFVACDTSASNTASEAKEAAAASVAEVLAPCAPGAITINGQAWAHGPSFAHTSDEHGGRTGIRIYEFSDVTCDEHVGLGVVTRDRKRATEVSLTFNHATANGHSLSVRPSNRNAMPLRITVGEGDERGICVTEPVTLDVSDLGELTIVGEFKAPLCGVSGTGKRQEGAPAAAPKAVEGESGESGTVKSTTERGVQ